MPDGEARPTSDRPHARLGSGERYRLTRCWLAGDETASDVGLGVGLPGFEDPAGSGVVQAPVLGWRHLPLGEHLTRVLGLPVLIDNDVNTLAMAESLYGLGRNLDSYLTVTLGLGIGLGIVVDGELYRGARGAAGEFGHVTANAKGERCACGKRGCLETLVAEPALVREARGIGALGPREGIAELLALAVAGDELALGIYRRAGRELGLAVANLAVVLNPGAILIGGEGRRGWPHLAETFMATFEANVFPPLAGTVPVRIVDWDDTKWALGAAALVLRAPFATPMHGNPAIDQIRTRLNVGFQAHRGEGGGSADAARRSFNAMSLRHREEANSRLGEVPVQVNPRFQS